MKKSTEKEELRDFMNIQHLVISGHLLIYVYFATAS